MHNIECINASCLTLAMSANVKVASCLTLTMSAKVNVTMRCNVHEQPACVRVDVCHAKAGVTLSCCTITLRIAVAVARGFQKPRATATSIDCSYEWL
jgi:hypothetical protein